jgi:thiol-disulfide isomerase/thioredoxin
MPEAALDGFKKADKQDDGHCLACQKNVIQYGIELRDWKPAETAAEEMIADAQGETAKAIAHYEFGLVLMQEGADKRNADKRNDELYSRAHEELAKALTSAANFPNAVFADGLALAHMKQDDQARARFEQFVKLRPAGDPDRQRAQRYIGRPELARARMAPPFAVTTMDGQRVSVDDWKGKVVLINFWATWCAACRETMPHMKDLVKKFQGQPLVVLSVSLDSDEGKWKEFVAKNGMIWLQYRDGEFTGPLAKLFGVQSLPQAFTIDTDGVLQDQRIADTAIESKLKKLLAPLQEIQVAEKLGQ